MRNRAKWSTPPSPGVVAIESAEGDNRVFVALDFGLEAQIVMFDGPTGILFARTSIEPEKTAAMRLLPGQANPDAVVYMIPFGDCSRLFYDKKNGTPTDTTDDQCQRVMKDYTFA